MKINLSDLKDSFEEAFDENSVLFVEHTGEPFVNWNVQGLQQSGYLSRPHLQFNLYGAKDHLYKGAQGDSARYDKNIELLFQEIVKYAEAWNGEITRKFTLFDLW